MIGHERAREVRQTILNVLREDGVSLTAADISKRLNRSIDATAIAKHLRPLIGTGQVIMIDSTPRRYTIGELPQDLAESFAKVIWYVRHYDIPLARLLEHDKEHRLGGQLNG